MTTNKLDFLTGIINSENIINLLLNKKEIDKSVFEASQELSNYHSKNITISFYFEKLYFIFKSIFIKINAPDGDRYKKLKLFEKVILDCSFFSKYLF